MDDADWLEAADDLGIKTRAVSISPLRLRRFIHDNTTGLFLIGTFDHLFVLDNGLIVDPREKMRGRYPGLGRIVKQVWRVLK
jgi:hypothetical protein